MPAMAVMTNEALATDPHLAARGVFVDIEHPEIGRARVMRAPWPFSDLDCVVAPGPLIGQDNDHVLDTHPRAVDRASAHEIEEVLR